MTTAENVSGCIQEPVLTSQDNLFNGTVSEFGELNCTTMNKTVPFENFEHAPQYIFICVTVVVAIIFLIGVAGNLLVVMVICWVRAMRNPTNYFLLSLTIADLCVLLVCQPVALMELHSLDRWYIGAFLCKTISINILIIMFFPSLFTFQLYTCTCTPF